MFCSVDPGKHFHGCALFEDGELVEAFYVPADGAWRRVLCVCPAECIELLLIEVPRIYSLSKSKGGLKGQNDLIDLAFSAGQLAGRFEEAGIEVCKIAPSDWKGQTPKDVVERRVDRALSAEEKARIESTSRSRMHNVIDGIGIGLDRLGRLHCK